MQRIFIYGNYIDEVLLMKAGENDYYYAHDHLYSPAALIDTSGNVLERYEYDAYGKPTIWNAGFTTERDNSNYGNPYLFTGRRVDILDSGSLKIQYNRNRYYDYYSGRWLTHDPLGITPNPQLPNKFGIIDQYKDGMNVYEYVMSTPTTKVDPKGLSVVITLCRLINIRCCTCLAYSETGRTGQECMSAIVHVMLNRQRSNWGDFSGENSFCDQAQMNRRWAGGFGSRRFDKCWECREKNQSELKEIKKAAEACAAGLWGVSVDPTGGAQFAIAAGHRWPLVTDDPDCERVNVPGCTITEFWRCTSPPGR